MNAAAASCGVNPANQAAWLLSVVPLLPATGRFMTAWIIGEVSQPPQLPVAAPYPVTQRAASVAARATAGDRAWRQRAAATATPLYIASRPSGRLMNCTGLGAQYRPSAASVAKTLAISSGVASLTPSVKEPQPSACSGEAIRLSTSVRQVSPSRSAIRTAFSAPI